jgi:hypothetical protein
MVPDDGLLPVHDAHPASVRVCVLLLRWLDAQVRVFRSSQRKLLLILLVLRSIVATITLSTGGSIATFAVLYGFGNVIAVCATMMLQG